MKGFVVPGSPLDCWAGTPPKKGVKTTKNTVQGGAKVVWHIPKAPLTGECDQGRKKTFKNPSPIEVKLNPKSSRRWFKRRDLRLEQMPRFKVLC